MIKKLLFIKALLLFTFPVLSQTMVGTTPENKKVILEEFTGVNCQFCPDGHAIAQSIKANNPDDFFIINIHQGGFANPGAGQPDFRTPFGNAIVAQSYNPGQTGFGYPAATVNRTVFPMAIHSGYTALFRNNWTSATNLSLAEPSYVNLGVSANIDVNTRELTVHVEAYYTGNSPEATNKLNVVLLQNNTLGPQTGGGMGNNYPHMHRLVHMLTGQWGVEVNTTTTGSFVDETFTYTIPADYNGVPVDFFEAELEVVVFMTETQQDIISGNGAYATYTGLTHANDASLIDVSDIMDQCSDMISPVIKIQNRGNNTLTSLDINYSINGGTIETYTWTGSLTPLLFETIELPEIAYSIQPVNSLLISLPNDDDNTNNVETIDFNESPLNGTGSMVLTVQTDGWGNEVRWNIKNTQGTTLYQGGPYGNNQTYTIPIILTDDCFTFTLIDTYGDGGGPVSLIDSDGTIIYSTNGNYGGGESVNFRSDGVLSVENNTIDMVTLYPNPSTGIINVQTKNTLDITIFDITGKQVFNASDISNKNQIDLNGLSAGLYLVKMNDGINQSTQKLIIK